MPNLDLTNLAQSFDITLAGTADYSAYVSSGSTFYSYLSSSGNLITLFGTGITIDGSAYPISGTITSVQIDLGNNNIFVPDIVLTGLNFDVTDLTYLAGSSANTAFWATVLAGETQVLNPTNTEYELTGDGTYVGAGRVLGRDDHLVGVNVNDVNLTGDFDTIETALVLGGNDLISGVFDQAFGDITRAYDALIWGGNDTIRPELDWTGDSATSGIGDISYISGSTLYGGDDLIDFSVNTSTRVSAFGDVYLMQDQSMLIGGHDVIRGGQRVGGGYDTLFGDVQFVYDTSVLIGGNDTLLGLAGSDLIIGDAEHVLGDAVAQGGNDLANGGDGNDTLYGDFQSASGNSIVTGGNDTLFGGDGDDTLIGDFGSAPASAVGGNDILLGEAGDDTLLGNGGDDTLNGGSGADELVGGDGEDWADYSHETSGAGIRLDGGVNFGSATGDTYFSIEHALGSAHNDTFVGSAGNNDLRGLAGADLIFAAGGADTLNGGAGNDTLRGQAGDDLILASAGNDIMDGGADQDTVDYGDMSTGAGIRLNGGTNFGSATGHVIQNVEHAIGSDFNDVIVGHGTDNQLDGGQGNDTIYALGGVDTLIGGAGDDVLYGQGGNDQFVFENGFGNDTIHMFNAGDGAEDIDLSGVTAITNFADLQANHMTQVGADVVIDDGLGNTITVTNTDLASLDATDFVF